MPATNFEPGTGVPNEGSYNRGFKIVYLGFYDRLKPGVKIRN